MKEYQNKMKNPDLKLNAIVLAAGLGTRMRPLTENEPKPLLPICNRPLLEIIISRLMAAGVGRVALNTHYLGERLAAWTKASPWSERIELFPEPEILGTGGPLVNAARILNSGDCFILHNGDILCDVDLAAMAAEHHRSGAAATLLTLPGPENKVRVLADGTITDILGRLGADEREGLLLTYGGIMVLSPEVLHYLPPEPVNCSIIPAVLELIGTAPGRVRAWRENGIYWNDLGTIERYFSAHRDLLGGVPHRLFKAGGNRVIASDAQIAPETLHGFACVGRGCRVGAGAMVENCVLLDGAEVEPEGFYINTVIGPDYAVHRDFARLSSLNILKGRELRHCRISSLREYGSARGFFRLRDGDRGQVLMVSDGSDVDFGRFVDMGCFLRRHGLPTPEIYAADRGEYTVLMEDLGNEMLYSRRVGLGGNLAGVEKVYRDTIAALVRFQTLGTRAVRQPDAPAIRIFDYDYLRWETRYFQDNFLVRLAGLPEEQVRALDPMFDLLAREADNRVKVFMHRDFQSQNIMLWRGEVRFVDFQGGRIGPAGYDIMSLLRDPYVEIPPGLRLRLLEYYIRLTLEQGGDLGLSEEELWRSVRLSGLQRIMQALGAYGFLSLTRGKMQYLQYVPRALVYLEEALAWLAAEPDQVDPDGLQQLWPAITGGWERRRHEYGLISGQ